MNVVLVKRTAAYALDILVLFLVLAPVDYLVEGGDRLRTPKGLEIWYTLLVGFSLSVWLYFIYSDRSAQGATLGKRLLGLRVSTRAGTDLNTWRAVGRTAITLFPWELVHVSAFALSVDMANPSSAQIVGLVTVNALVLVYLGVAAATGGRRSVHDLVLSTEVRPLQ